MTPDAMAEIHARCFPDRPWSAQEFQDMMDARGMVWIVNREETGFIFARLIPPEAEILTLAVDPDARRQGVGSGLIEGLLDMLPSVNVSDLFLEVASDNDAAQSLYENHRFQVTGRRKGYYTRTDGPNADALLMQRAVTQGPDH